MNSKSLMLSFQNGEIVRAYYCTSYEWHSLLLWPRHLQISKEQRICFGSWFEGTVYNSIEGMAWSDSWQLFKVSYI